MYNKLDKSCYFVSVARNFATKENEMADVAGVSVRFAIGTPLFVEIGGSGKVLLLNAVGTEKANLITLAPTGEVPFQGGELPFIKQGTVGEKDLEHYILSYLKKVSSETPKITILQGYFLATEGEGIYTTEKPTK